MHPDDPKSISRLRFEHRPRRRLRRLIGRTGTHVAVAVAALSIVGGGGYALASSRSSRPIHGCINKRSGVVSVRAHCARNSRALVWNRQGPRGKAGTTTTVTRMAPSGWTVDFLSAPAMFDPRQTDPSGAIDSYGIASVTVVQNGEDRVVASGCHDHAPTVIGQADPGEGRDGSVPQAVALVPVGDGFASVDAARPNTHGDETFDVFTYVPDPTAGNVLAGGELKDVDLDGNDFTLLIYC